VWAIGDATGILPFTHVGKYQGRIAARDILGQSARADYRAVPRVVFTDPQVAVVGEATGELAAETPYPHVFDQDTEAVRSLEWQGVSPTTWLIDEQGEIVHQRPGAYASREQLDADIDRFLLEG
jgi:pyruvate/2-oxoglutarate dehydrogenase complex dihydrolipoamide dehydrogenase (E3) component